METEENEISNKYDETCVIPAFVYLFYFNLLFIIILFIYCILIYCLL